MKRIAIVANCEKERAAVVLERLGEVAGELGLELVGNSDVGKLLKSVAVLPEDKLFDDVDAVIAVGGDGTMIRAVRELDGQDKPVMGLNIGGLGFMTSITEDDSERALKCLASGDFVTSDRAIAECTIERAGKEVGSYRGLNDMVVRRGSRSRIVTLELSIGGENVTSYVCDGLMVSTPTGSTGHSLSAGGPILHPDTSAFVISLICPHTLSTRPMVVPDSSSVSIVVVDSSGELLLTVDGQMNCALEQGDIIRVKRNSTSARFIYLPGHSYYAVLRQKLRWRGSNV